MKDFFHLWFILRFQFKYKFYLFTSMCLFISAIYLPSCTKGSGSSIQNEIILGNQIWKGNDFQDSTPYSWTKDGIRFYGFQAIQAIESSNQGWHVPTYQDWLTLLFHIGMDTIYMLNSNWPLGEEIKQNLGITNFPGWYSAKKDSCIYPNRVTYWIPSEITSLSGKKYLQQVTFFIPGAPKSNTAYNALCEPDTTLGFSIRLMTYVMDDDD